MAFQVPDYYNQQMWYLGLGAERDETVRLYTPMFVDLYDTFNQNKWYGYWSPGRTKDDLDRTPDDDICMLTIREIQEIAFGSKTNRRLSDGFGSTPPDTVLLRRKSIGTGRFTL